MEVASCGFCGSRSIPTTTTATFSFNVGPSNAVNSPLHLSFSSSFRSVCLLIGRQQQERRRFVCSNDTTSGTKKRPKAKPRNKSNFITQSKIPKTKTSYVSSNVIVEKSIQETPKRCKPVNVGSLHQNGDPLGRKDLGKSVVKWLSQGMRAMASDFASTEALGEGEFYELRQKMDPGLTFVIQAQPYLNATPMPLGLEALCLKASTHYPTLFDHFQRELRDVLQQLQNKSMVQQWQQTQSWKFLKELANSGTFLSLLSCSIQALVLYFVD